MKRKGILCFILSIIAFHLGALGNYADSLLNLLETRTLPLADQIGAYHMIAEWYSGHDLTNTYTYGMKGLELAKKAKDKYMIATFYRYIGTAYVYRANYDTAHMYQQMQLEIAEELQDKRLLQQVYFTTGNIYARQGLFDKAVNNYLKSMSYYSEDMHKGVTMPIVLRNLEKSYLFYSPVRTYILSMGNAGECYRRLNNPERALYYLEQAKNIIEEKKFSDNTCRMQVYRELGNIYFINGNMDKALEAQLEVLHIPGGLNPVGESDCKEALIKIYIIKEEYDKALEYAHDCLRLAESLGDPYIDVHAWNSFANIYRAQGKYPECEEAALNAWRIDSTSIDTAPESALNIAYANLYLGNKEKAALYFQKNAAFNEQKSNRDFQEVLADLEVRYETEKKEMRIMSLEKEKQLHLWLSIAGAIALLLAFGVLFYRYRLNIQKGKIADQQCGIAEQHIRQLEQEKQIVAAQSLLEGETIERSRLARDLHDGLGGMLSVVKLNLSGMKNYAVLNGTGINYFNTALNMVDQSIAELRRVAHHIMPKSLIRYGLKTSIEDYCCAIPDARFYYFGGEERLDGRQEVVLYRCVYELVNNAVKYAKATEINVQLIIDNGLVSLTVHDNGVGFDPERITSGSGLDNIRARVSVYNGKMIIYSAPGKGTEVNVEIENLEIE
ncbi:MAG: sensor histidine kinase [Tannerella sp.]|jgi:signal transduction histidine kinase|nr:sensor histidine kinase [Tannerella sp.]